MPRCALQGPSLPHRAMQMLEQGHRALLDWQLTLQGQGSLGIPVTLWPLACLWLVLEFVPSLPDTEGAGKCVWKARGGEPGFDVSPA